MSESRTVLVTGSGRPRVGQYVARSLLERGWSVGIHYHSSEESAKEFVAQQRSLDRHAARFQADLSDEQQADALVARFVGEFGRIDGLICTASDWKTEPLETLTAEQLLRSFRINTLGSLLVARSAGLEMTKQQSGGSIVLFGDWSVERPYPDHLPYFASKGALPTVTKALAVELATRNPGIRVNCIQPGPILFPEGLSARQHQQKSDVTLLKRGGDPECVAQTVQMLLDNEFITGTVIPVDGGRTIFAPGDGGSGPKPPE